MKKYALATILSIVSFGFASAQMVTDILDTPEAPSCTMLTYGMSYGSKDSRTRGEVSDLQFFLNQKGYLTSEPTGFFGLQTKFAVQAFQRANKITPNGTVGPYTRAAIRKAGCDDIVSLAGNPVSNANQVASSSLQNEAAALDYPVQTTSTGYPTISGMANVPSVYVNVVNTSGNSITGTGAIPVINGRWSAPIVSTLPSLPNGRYTVRVYNTAENSLLVSGGVLTVDTSTSSGTSSSRIPPVITFMPKDGPMVDYGSSATVSWSVKTPSGDMSAVTCEPASATTNLPPQGTVIGPVGSYTFPKVVVPMSFGIKCVDHVTNLGDMKIYEIYVKPASPLPVKPGSAPITDGDLNYNWLQLSGSGCAIGINQNTCTLYATWKTTSKSAPALVEQTTQDDNLTTSSDIISTKASQESEGLAVQIGRSSRLILANNVTATGQEFIASLKAAGTCADGLVWDKKKKLCVDGSDYPDLVASAVVPARLVLDSDVPLSATITNKGWVSTGSPLQSYIQLTTYPKESYNAPKDSYVTFLQAATPILGPGESKTLTQRYGTYLSSSQYVPGTYSARACVDTADSIPEKDETNNCGPWVDVIVANTCAASSTLQWSSCTGALPERGLSDSENVNNTAPGYYGTSHWMCSPTTGLWTQVNLSQTTCAKIGTVSMSSVAPSVLGVSTKCTDLSLNLHRGYESASVTKLQNFLASAGLLDEATGFYGDKTVTAIKEYQASKNLPQTGMVYNLTRAAIKADSCQ